MMEIIFEPHATSLDNEAGLASGWNDVALSPLGEQQATEMGKRYEGQRFETIFCSDLQRSYKTAELAFGSKYPIVQDERLRECDYGELTQADKKIVDAEKAQHISRPFPGGESYEQTCARMAEFLADVRKNYAGRRVLIIGHRATQYGLEHSILGKPIAEVVTAPWKWQPGWRYELHD
jgi:broad specificity phosphatase PhoE